MPTYQVLARKYRPQKFSELVGQDALVRTLTNAISSNKVAHAFILTGIRGVGKTSTARLIAKSLNCIGLDGQGKETIDPCLQCVHCRAIANSIDQDVVEFDAASHTGVNDIRDIIDSINYPPAYSRYRIFIIDEVHMLSNSAFNALLKTLEEPPNHVKFIFATTEIRKVPITILSRCIRFDLNRINHDILTNYLIDIAKKEGIKLAESSAALISFKAEGSVRDALSLLDRIISFNEFKEEIRDELVCDALNIGNKEQNFRLYSFLLKNDINSTLTCFDEIYLSLSNYEDFINDLMDITHKLLLKKNNIRINYITPFEEQWLEKSYETISSSALFRIWQFLVKGLQDMKYISNHRIFLETLLLKILYGSDIPEITDIIKKLQNNSRNPNIPVDNTGKDDLLNKVLNKFEGSRLV